MSFYDKILKAPSSPNELFGGVSLLARGFFYAWKNKEILALCLIPVCVTTLFLWYFFSPGYSYIYDILSDFLIQKKHFNFFLGKWVLKLASFFLKLVAILMFVFFSYVLLNILNMPFCSLLAEKVLKNHGIVQVKGFSNFFLFNFKMLRVSLLKALFIGILGFCFFLSSFFPLLSVLPVYFAFLTMAYDGFDYGLELYGFNFQQRRVFFSRQFLVINGHSGVLFVLSVVPGLILIMMPFAVVGASLRLREIYES